MFKPITLFIDKKLKDASDSSEPIPETSRIHENLVNLWKTLSEKKMKKFILKAEKRYDAAFRENPTLPLFSTFLTANEITVFFKSYGMPDKVAGNSRFYLLKKLSEKIASEQENASPIELKEQAEAQLAKLSEEEKKIYLMEYQNSIKEYNYQYFDFVRNLPETRVEDFKKTLLCAFDKKKGETSIELKDLNQRLMPAEAFYLNFKKENQTMKPLLARAEAMRKYRSLSNKKKLIWIKQAEKLFDEEMKNGNEFLKKQLAMYLTKNELHILLQSYGLPEGVGSNVSAYYYKLNCAKFDKKDRMKAIMIHLRSLPEEEKNELIEKHKQATAEYAILKKKFLDNLPLRRLDDYNYYKSKPKDHSNGTVKQGKTSLVENGHLLSDEKDAETVYSEMDDEDKSKDSKEDQNSVYESADEADKLDNEQSKEMQEFLMKTSKRYENSFSIFIQEEVSKQNTKLNKVDSTKLLTNLAKKWNVMNENDKETYEVKFDLDKKSLKKNIKEFLANNKPEMTKYELLDKINEVAYENNRNITFILNESETINCYLIEKVDYIHSSINKIEIASDHLTEKLTVASIKNHKRKIENDLNSINSNSPKKTK